MMNIISNYRVIKEYKYLGIVIDNKMNLRNHIVNIDNNQMNISEEIIY